MPVVTIRCITYNHEPYIRQCLEGFVMQQTNFKFEAVVHDDASTDGTAAVVAEFAQKYPDIIKPLYETENQYSKRDGSLRRIMDAHMRGKYIALCEGDDYWTDPHKLQRQVDFLESHPEVGLCLTNADKYRQDDGTFERNCFDAAINERISSLDSYMMDSVWLAPCTWVLRSDLYQEYSAWIEGTNFKLGDLAVVSFIMSRSRVAFIDEVTSVYRIHGGGVSNSKNKRVNFEFGRSVYELRHYICDTLLEDGAHIKRIKDGEYATRNIKNILVYLDKREGMEYLQHIDSVTIKGVTLSVKFISKYYNLVAMLVKLENLIFGYRY